MLRISTMRTRMLVFLVLSTALVVSAEGRPSYVFKRGSKSHLRANGSIDEAARISKKYSGDFIWVREGGHEYVIRDAAVLAEADAAFRDLDAFEPTLHEAEKKVKPYEDRMAELEKHMDEISDKFDEEGLSDSAREDLEVKLHDVEEQIRGIEEKMRGVEADLEHAEELMDDREELAEQKLELILDKAIRMKRIEN